MDRFGSAKRLDRRTTLVHAAPALQELCTGKLWNPLLVGHDGQGRTSPIPHLPSSLAEIKTEIAAIAKQIYAVRTLDAHLVSFNLLRKALVLVDQMKTPITIRFG
jgi:hypothetical protein